MAVTIRDVAALAGVSPATVSRTCNHNPAISAETREKVWQAIATLGYKVPVSATENAINSTNEKNIFPANNKHNNTIGIIMKPQEKKGYDNPFVTRSMRGICQAAMERSYSTLIISGENYPEMLAYIQGLMQMRKVQGFVFLYSALDDPLISYMHQYHIPFVVIGKASAYVNDTVYVDNDNLVAGQDAANYLIDMGHKKIAFVCDNISQIFAYERNAGFRLSMLQHNLEIPESYVICGISMPLDKQSSLAHLLLSDNRPTALLIIDDTVALAALQLCHELNIKVPEDLSILTFNNSVMVKLSTPPLSTVDINSRQLGVEAGTQLINMIENPNMSATKIIVPHYLVKRASCTPPKGEDSKEAE